MSNLTFNDALRTLQRAQKPSAGVSLYSRFVNRPAGRVLAAGAAAAGLSPNAVTGLSAAATIAGLLVLVLAPVTWLTGVLVAALLALGFALDSADGQVSRLTGRGSPAGEWLDHVVDAGKMVAVHAAVLIAAYTHGLLQGFWLLLPLGYLLAVVVMFSGMTIFELLMRSLAEKSQKNRSPSLLRAFALLPADYGILAISFVLWGTPAVFFVVYAALGVATASITVLLLTKWFRTLSRVQV